MLQYSITDKFLRTLEHLEYGSMVVITPDGKKHVFHGKTPGINAHFHIHDWRTIPAFASKGDIGLAEAYRDGWWDSEDLTRLFLVGLQNTHALNNYIYGNMLSRVASRFFYIFTRNTLKGSRRNIHAHYDLGNEFYNLWLDPGMSYSSALFHHETESLEQAQHNKYDRMLERLDARTGNLLEIGCGWGGLAERAIEKYDFSVKGITLSEQQHAYAKKRLGNHAEIVIEDYRSQKGTYDHIISIEMFEAVGEKFWPLYFNKLQSLLTRRGKAVIQTITIGDQYFERYRKGGDMIRSFIFPGGMLPTPMRFRQEAERAGLRITDCHAFGKDYTTTLTYWLHTFESRLSDVRALGFDEAFIRIWQFYLASCIASFAVGRTDVIQMELQHA